MMLQKKSQHLASKKQMVERQTTPPGDPMPVEQRIHPAPPGEKVRLSADIKIRLYQRLRIHVATTNSRINTFIEDMIEKHC